MLIEGDLNCLLLQKSALDVVTLLLTMGVLAWAWIQKITLLSEWSSDIVLPEVTSLCRAHEGVSVLATSGGEARSIVQ